MTDYSSLFFDFTYNEPFNMHEVLNSICYSYETKQNCATDLISNERLIILVFVMFKHKLKLYDCRLWNECIEHKS